MPVAVDTVSGTQRGHVIRWAPGRPPTFAAIPVVRIPGRPVVLPEARPLVAQRNWRKLFLSLERGFKIIWFRNAFITKAAAIEGARSTAAEILVPEILAQSPPQPSAPASDGDSFWEPEEETEDPARRLDFPEPAAPTEGRRILPGVSLRGVVSTTFLAARTALRVYASFFNTPRLRRNFRDLALGILRLYLPGLAAGHFFQNFQQLWEVVDWFL